MDTYVLFGAPGTGSAIVEAMLRLTNIPYVIEDHAFDQLGPDSPYTRLLQLNPLGQVPTLVLPDETVLTESAAIALFLGEQVPQSGLTPEPNSPLRPAFLRWLIFLGSAYYNTFTYGDFPKRWVRSDEAAAELVQSTKAHRKRLLRYLESSVVGQPWFLGSSFSALDIYLYVMGAWSPGAKWVAANCPHIAAIRERLQHDARFEEVWSRHFPDPPPEK